MRKNENLMKIHTANYFDTFIEVADDTKVNCGKTLADFLGF